MVRLEAVAQQVGAGGEFDDIAGGVVGVVDGDGVGVGVEKQRQGARRGERADERAGVEGETLEEELADIR